jgi:hypothetical protein
MRTSPPPYTVAFSDGTDPTTWRRLSVSRHFKGFDHDALVAILDGEPLVIDFENEREGRFAAEFVKLLMEHRRQRREVAR